MEKDSNTNAHVEAAPQPSLLEMEKQLIYLALPNTIANAAWGGVVLLTQSEIGRNVGVTALAEYSVAISFFNAFGLSIGWGMSSALDTLAPQAYGRDPLSAEIGELLQVSFVVNTACLILSSLFFFLSHPLIHLLFGDLADGIYDCLRLSIPYLTLMLFNQSIVRTLTAQNEPTIGLGSYVVASVASYCLILLFDAPSSSSGFLFLAGGQLIAFIFLIAVCIFHPRVILRKATWPSPMMWHWPAIRLYLTVGIPSLATVVAEWWAFEVLQIIAAQASDATVALLSICLSLTSLLITVPFGISLSGSVCIGNALGRGQVETAKSFVALTMITAISASFSCAVLIVLLRYQLPAFYSRDSSIIEYFGSTLAIAVAIFHMLDSTQYTLLGVYRGAGKQVQSTKITVVTLWLVGVTLSATLSLAVNMGTMGILVGLGTGFISQISLLWGLVHFWDWEDIEKRAMELSIENDPPNLIEDAHF